jgi:hypothetical protein
VSGAAARLARVLLGAGAKRVAFLGLAKNAGKTTALVATLRELHALGIPAGATSVGRDGEDFDALTGDPKPRFHYDAGQLAASAETTFDGASLAATPLERLPFSTRFGRVAVARVDRAGEIEMIGPTTVSQTADTAAALERHGARIVLLDGAFGRRAFASARVADGIVLAAGMSAGGTIESALARARAAVELVTLPVPARGASVRRFEGALTDELVHEAAPRPGETLAARDFASIFLSEPERIRLRESEIALAVENPARLLAVTANPTAPGRPPKPATEFFEALGGVVPAAIPLFDLEAGLVRGA